MHGFLAALFPVAVLLFFDALIPLLRAEPSCLVRCAGRLCRLLFCVFIFLLLFILCAWCLACVPQT